MLSLPLSAAAQAPAPAASVERAEQAMVEIYQLEQAGRVAEAIQAAGHAVELWSALPAEHADDLVVSLITLGSLQLRAERYAEASTALVRALGLLQKRPESSYLVTLEYSLGSLYEKTGGPLEAERLFRHALDVLKRLPGSHVRDTAIITSALAHNLQRRGDLKGAEELARRSLTLTEGDPQLDRADLVPALSNLASILKDKGDYGQAEAFSRRALDVTKAAPRPDELTVAGCMTNLAVILAARGRFAEAQEQALSALERYGHAKYSGAEAVAALEALVYAFWGQGDMEEAIRFQTLVAQGQELAMAPILRVGTQAQKAQYVSSSRARLDTVVSMHLRSAPNNPQAARAALTAVLTFKGRALDASASGVRQLLAQDNEVIRSRFVRMLEERRKLASYTLRIPPALRSKPEYRKQELEMRMQIDVIERTLNERMGATDGAPTVLTVDRVAAALTPGSALIELCVFWPIDPRKPAGPKLDEARYAAYVLLPDADVRAIDLGPVTAIDALVARARTALSTDGGLYQAPARALYATLIRPLLPLLKGATELFVDPDGQLNLLPMAALLDEHDQFLLRSHRFTYLTTGRDLLQFAQRDAPRSGPVVYAAPQFDASNDSPVVNGSDRAPSSPSALRFEPLVGTMEEARVLSDILKLPPDAVHTGSAASEDSLVNLHGPSILHLATHGFLLGSASAGARDTRGAELVDAQTVAKKAGDPFDDPLLWSGIALAGANRQGGKLDDGVVTALELTGMDLRGTQLVTLSACETGLGSVRAGDGVYGLRRALVLAGSEAQLTTLWKVADTETAQLMADYYRRLARGEGRSEALRSAQVALLGKHPFYWAAFTISGDPTPLHGALGLRKAPRSRAQSAPPR
jgi:CHAT domain-containing protein/tetratricopeptide (TPR) repeat protein